MKLTNINAQICGAHVDNHFHIKPNPRIKVSGFCRMNATNEIWFTVVKTGY